MTTTPATVANVNELASELIEDAKQHHARRTARTLTAGTSQRATLIGMAADAELAKHDSPNAATVHVITGRVRLYTADSEWVLSAGEIVTVPVERHAVQAIKDSAILLTVALR